jgi:RimJ/RimL family protein N-acetyltransferase
MPLPLRTERLTIRMMKTADAARFAEYRNDPEVARYQLWDMPYTVEAATNTLADQDAHDQLIIGEWTQLAVEADGVVVGDVCTHIDATANVAEIGYTLAREYQGHGYAREAAGALVDELVDVVGVGRIFGELDPENVASQRVLEALGLTFEAVTKRSFLWRGEWVDNMAYATTADEYRAWRSRPTEPPDVVELVELDHRNARDFAALRTHKSEERFVAPVSASYTDALFPEVDNGGVLVPWLRGITADGEPAGFLMTAEVTATNRDPFLWRLLIDRRHQRRGIARRVLLQLSRRLRDDGCQWLYTSWVDGPGSPRPFYERFGFVPTGKLLDGEVVARLRLDDH